MVRWCVSYRELFKLHARKVDVAPCIAINLPGSSCDPSTRLRPSNFSGSAHSFLRRARQKPSLARREQRTALRRDCLFVLDCTMLRDSEHAQTWWTSDCDKAMKWWSDCLKSQASLIISKLEYVLNGCQKKVMGSVLFCATQVQDAWTCTHAGNTWQSGMLPGPK